MNMVLQPVKCKNTVDTAIDTIGKYIAENMHVGDALPSERELAEQRVFLLSNSRCTVSSQQNDHIIHIRCVENALAEQRLRDCAIAFENA